MANRMAKAVKERHVNWRAAATAASTSCDRAIATHHPGQCWGRAIRAVGLVGWATGPLAVTRATDDVEVECFESW